MCNVTHFKCPLWALNDPYTKRLMKMDLRELKLEIYGELKLIKESNKSFERRM